MDKDFKGDTLLLLDLKNSSEQAYSYIIDEYYSRLYTYALNLSNDHSLAEDIVQNVYMNIWEKREKLNTDIPIKKLLYKAVYHNFITLYKKKRAIGNLEEKYMQTVDFLIEENENSSIATKLKILNKEIKKLPPKCKKVFLLSKQEGLSNKEISSYLNISINTVENHISKAFSILRERVKTVSKSVLFFLFRSVKY